VTGVFFAIFALFFAQNAWRMRSAWRAGEEHRHFLIYLLLLLVFAYFSATAFWNGRAAAHTKKGRV
jgi:F0F1-type ATP synthase assembly protein I